MCALTEGQCRGPYYFALTLIAFEEPLQPKILATFTVQLYFLPFFSFLTVNTFDVPLTLDFELPTLHVALALLIGAPP